MYVIKIKSPLLLITLIVLCLSNSASAKNNKQTGLDKVEAEKWRADLRYMAEEMPLRHRNLFHTMTREQFNSAIKRLDERIPQLARHQIIVEMARIVAMVSDGHTNIAPTRDPKIHFRAYPLKLYFFKDGLFVRAAHRDYKDLVGARVIKIGNASVDQAYSAVRELIGRDNEMGARFFAPFYFVMPEVLHALGLIADVERASFVLEIQGQQKAIELKPLGEIEMAPADTDVSWITKSDWIDARDNDKAAEPLWLRDPRNKFWFEYLPQSRTLYVQLNQIGNKEETLAAFSQRVFEFVESNPVERLALDLRLNRGGNGYFNRAVVRNLIKSTKIDQRGKLFTIIGRSTWSAAQFLVNEMEKYTNTLFVGEPTGSKLNHYGDSRRIYLPNSGITVRVSSLWWQEDERDTRQWVAPQIAADLTFEDYRMNVDPALKAILNYKPAKPLEEEMMAAIEATGIESALKLYHEFKSDPVNAYFDTNFSMRVLGYNLMSKNRLDDALRIFKMNSTEHPDSDGVYEDLGAVYAKMGKREIAVENYKKAVSLNPRNWDAVEALKNLTEK